MSKQDNQLIWHYCAPETFMSIIESKTIRFSSVYHTNDYGEMDWGLSLADKMVEKYFSKEDFLEEYQTNMRSWFKDNAFLISCFSYEEDLLSQWRGYANNGLGFAIGFDKRQLDNIFSKCVMGDVEYNFESEILDGYIKALRDDFVNPHSDKDVTYELLTKIGHHVSLLKAPAFKEEGEYRYVMEVKSWDRGEGFTTLSTKSGQAGKGTNRIRFILKNGSPVPYYDWAFGDSSFSRIVKKVIIGPRNASSIKSIELFLSMSKHKGFDVTKSKISYR